MAISWRASLLFCLLLTPIVSLSLARDVTFAGRNLPASEPTITPVATIPLPRSVTFDNAGNLFTISRDTGVIYKITPTGTISVIANLPDGNEGYAALLFDSTSGNLLVSRNMYRSGFQVLQVTPAGAVSVFAAPLPSPGGLALDANGTLYVALYSCPGTIAKVTRTGTISTFATGVCWPDGLAFGPDGDLFVGNRGTNQIMRVPASGGVATVSANGFLNPMDVEVDQLGRLFVTNFDNGTIAVVDSTGAASTFVSGLSHPVGIAFDQQNQLYIADYTANKIVKVLNTSTPTLTPTITLTPTATPILTPTITLTPTATPILTPTITLTPTATPIQMPTMTLTPTMTPLATATPISTPTIAGRLTINGGALTTTSVNVSLALSVASSHSGQIDLRMSFSNNGVTWSDWQPYAPVASWQLSPGNGPKKVYARVKNSSESISAIVSDTITLNTNVQAEYGVTINNGALFTNKVAVQLKISAQPRTAEMQVSNDGGFENAAWEPYTAFKDWQLLQYRHNEITMLVYVRFRDVDGKVTAASDSIILDINPPHGYAHIGQANAMPRLELMAADDVSGVAGMRVSTRPDFADAGWETFAASPSWDFASHPIAYVQFSDLAGNVSATYIAGLGDGQLVFLPLVQR